MGETVRQGGPSARRFATVGAIAAVLGIGALAISMSDPGDAAFPGTNGKIVYTYGNPYGGGGVWTANANGSSPTMLTNGTGDYDPTYSPNGSRIAFERENGIAVMNADGSGQTQLLSGSSSHSSKTEWKSEYEAPGGKKLKFAKIESSINTWHRFGEPSFSPDGTQLAIVKGSEDFNVVVTCAVGEAEGKACLEYGDPEHYFNVEFECIACASQVITVSATSGAVTGEVTPAKNQTYSWGPAYSVDGKLAFAHTPEAEAGSKIFVVNSPGAAPVQITNGFSDHEPDFSPDGSRIVFIHGSGEVGLVGAGGGPVTILPVPNPSKGPQYAISPAFSPDGSTIVFERSIFPSGNPESGIYTIAAVGSGLTRILTGSEPSWQPIPLPPPPPPIAASVKAKKGKIRLNKKSQATIGNITCGSSPCALKALSSKLKAGKEKCSAKVKLPKSLAVGKKTGVKVKVAGKCLAALKEAGKGKLVTEIAVTEALGKKVFTLKSSLLPPKAKKGKGKK
jgi:dipeptidyl aminopeptidase/acylaminoacyl peptidase